MPIFHLVLHPAYYNTGFFNVTVEFDKYIRDTEGKVKLMLGNDVEIEGTINRHANRNRTARIMGETTLRDWFQSHFDVNETIDVDLGSTEVIRLSQTFNQTL